MNGPDSPDEPIGGHVTFRYWASVRAAAGRAEEQIAVDGPTALSVLIARILPEHVGNDRFEALLGTCSVLVGDRPVASADPEQVEVLPGQVVEFLPPFAGG